MTSHKHLSEIRNLRDLRSIPRSRMSGKPQLPTTAVLNLYMVRNEKDRLIKERICLLRRKQQVEERLQEIEKEMNILTERVEHTVHKLRGDVQGSPAHKAGRRVVVEY